jgi:hypothetical protein
MKKDGSFVCFRAKDEFLHTVTRARAREGINLS